MTIKEVEEKTGLPRSNIRFYEKEKLIIPVRNDSNGYRDYSKENVKNIQKIAYLRTLGVSIEDIHNIISHKVSLHEIIKEQTVKLNNQMIDLEKAKVICEKMLMEEELDYEELKIERYMKEMSEYWKANTKLPKVDRVNFLYIWGGVIVWGIITMLSLFIAVLFFPHLPREIPIQWNKGVAVSYVYKGYIFAYPAACIVIRFLLRPLIWKWIKQMASSFELENYFANFLCFVALSFEIFTLFFIHGLVKSILVVILVDALVLFGLLLKTGIKID